eukprot:TRINITY_DN8835_c0_g1_i1.p1 TRINITY_DN8835_c0_g1~~TRINITY_DN8835_c0_g1_i1.p1  ORF type:complete len:129 (+),score=10.96 TRINITY_DN8835_c0_g1_i1:41-388(+)
MRKNQKPYQQLKQQKGKEGKKKKKRRILFFFNLFIVFFYFIFISISFLTHLWGKEKKRKRILRELQIAESFYFFSPKGWEGLQEVRSKNDRKEQKNPITADFVFCYIIYTISFQV